MEDKMQHTILLSAVPVRLSSQLKVWSITLYAVSHTFENSVEKIKMRGVSTGRRMCTRIRMAGLQNERQKDAEQS